MLLLLIKQGGNGLNLTGAVGGPRPGLGVAEAERVTQEPSCGGMPLREHVRPLCVLHRRRQQRARCAEPRATPRTLAQPAPPLPASLSALRHCSTTPFLLSLVCLPCLAPLPAEAQHVVLCEPLLDPAVEAQAVGRVDRIGQQRATHVHRCLARRRRSLTPCACACRRQPQALTALQAPGTGNAGRAMTFSIMCAAVPVQVCGGADD